MDKNSNKETLLRDLIREALIQELSNVEQLKAAFGAGASASLKKRADTGKSAFGSKTPAMSFEEIENEAKKKSDIAMEVISKASLHVIDVNNLLDILLQVLGNFGSELRDFSNKIIDVSSASQQELVEFIKEIKKINESAGKTAGAVLAVVEKSSSGKSMERLIQLRKNTEKDLESNEMWMYWSSLQSTFKIYVDDQVKGIQTEIKKLFGSDKVKDYLKSQSKEQPKLLKVSETARSSAGELSKKSEEILKLLSEYEKAGDKIKEIQDEMELSAFKADLNNQYSDVTI